MDTVYYCSSISGYKVIDKNSLEIKNGESTFCLSKITSILDFIAKNNDFSFSVGKDLKSDLCFICERFKGGLLSTLKGKKLSVYKLKQNIQVNFEACWADKFVISAPSKVFEEEIIMDVYDFLVELSKKEILTICWYPERINGIPKDDQDLVELAILRYRMYGDSVISEIVQYHPGLVNRVMQGIESEAFREYGL